jgi:peptidoglycan hydrolase-like protein with peptidoglycan-binding domain
MVGMSGEDVTKLQERLTAEGVYTGPITGYFGPVTRAGVEAFQVKAGIDPHYGYVGPLTLAKLNESCTSATTEGASVNDLEAQIEILKAQIAAFQKIT